VASNIRGKDRKHSARHNDTRREQIIHYMPVWIIATVIAAMLLPSILNLTVDLTIGVLTGVPRVAVHTLKGGADLAGDMVTTVKRGVGGLFGRSAAGTGSIAPLFTPQVQHWGRDIDRWAETYSLDPNLLATVMQIESCGHPTVSSHAGAQGLFQVMPFHFASDENQIDPNTNAMRGAGVLNECLNMANGDTGLAMACYNGGPSVLQKPFNQWLDEPQRYYVWGTGIYADAQRDTSTSATLDNWLAAGGSSLCQRASSELGLG
jgi:hypothetical protein